MPLYTCTTTTGTLTADVKSGLAQEISRIHAEINHVPSTYVNVVFHELPAGGIYTDGVPANPVLVNSWVRSGHPADKTTLLATEIAAVVSGSPTSTGPGNDGDPKQPRKWRGRKRPRPARARPRAGVDTPEHDDWAPSLERRSIGAPENSRCRA